MHRTHVIGGIAQNLQPNRLPSRSLRAGRGKESALSQHLLHALLGRMDKVAPGWTYDAAMIAVDSGAGHDGALSVEVRQVGTFATGRAATVAIAT